MPECKARKKVQEAPPPHRVTPAGRRGSLFCKNRGPNFKQRA